MYQSHEDASSSTNIKTLERIPTLYLNLLIQLGPLIKYMALFTDILSWINPSKSIVTIFVWIIICTWTQRCLVFGLPCLFLVKLIWNWFNPKIIRKRRETKEDKQLNFETVSVKLKKQQEAQQTEEDLFVSKGIQPNDQILLQDTLVHLQVIQTWWSHSPWKQSFSYAYRVFPRHAFCIWLIWAMINYMLGSHGVFALVGTWLLVSCSPWYRMIVLALTNNLILYHYVKAFFDYEVVLITYILLPKNRKNTSGTNNIPSPPLTPTVSTASHEEIYRCEVPLIFEVYENQRWWFSLGWNGSLLSSERAPWTDSHLQPIVSKEEYHLPEDEIMSACFKGKQGQLEPRRTIKSWVWNDRDWWIDMSGELQAKVDRNGWAYGNNSWQQMMGMRGPHTFTRQRKWCRRAKLIERQLVYYE